MKKLSLALLLSITISPAFAMENDQERVADTPTNTHEGRLRILENNDQEREDREFRHGCFIAGVLVALAVSNACTIS